MLHFVSICTRDVSTRVIVGHNLARRQFTRDFARNRAWPQTMSRLRMHECTRARTHSRIHVTSRAIQHKFEDHSELQRRNLVLTRVCMYQTAYAQE